ETVPGRTRRPRRGFARAGGCQATAGALRTPWGRSAADRVGEVEGQLVGVEGLGARDDAHVEAVARRVAELVGDVTDAVAAGERRELQEAEDAERPARAVEERAAGVTGDARRDREHRVLPAAGVVAEGHARLRAEQRDALAQDGVAVRVHG